MDSAKRAAIMALRNVVDPELGLDVVALGLVYGLEATERDIQVSLTLTTPGCPLGDSILAMAREALEGVSGGRTVRLRLVWSPLWSPSMISREGLEALRT